MDTLYYDQYDYKIDDNPYGVFKRLRDEAPLWYNPKYDYWVLSRFDDVRRASDDHATFSSAFSTVLELMSETPGESPNLLFNDPPFHDYIRRMVAAQFSPAKVAKLESEVRNIVLSYLEPLEGRESFDFVQDFARWIPMDVISTLLGVTDPADRRNINQWGDDILHREEGNPEEPENARQARINLTNFVAEAVMDRRKNPRDDLITLISTGDIRQIDGSSRKLSDREAIENIFTIGAAGNETVARLLGSAGWLLAKYPEQRQKLRDDPSLIPNAREEMLRFEAPSPIQFRRVMKDVVLHGTTVPAGSNICLLTAAAGRDERQYPNPDVFDIERENILHVTFGHGLHACLGSHVARLEIRIALEEVLKRIPDWEVDEANMVRVRTSTVRGFSHVPVYLKH